MSDCDRQKNKPIDDRSTVDATAAKKSVGYWRLIGTAAATVVRIFFGQRTLSVGQYDALLASTWLVWLDVLYMMIKKNIQ